MSAPALASPLTSPAEVHHAVPRCLLRLHEDATSGDLDGAGIQAWLEWEWEAMRWGVPVEIAREALEGLIERSTVLLEREKHRLIHGSDWQRWGRRGGLATLRRYGTSWYSALALKRWGRLDAEDLHRARVVGSAHFAELARRSRRRPVREG
jgi:hypothetical protein